MISLNNYYMDYASILLEIQEVKCISKGMWQQLYRIS
jgi:hypothetical protein